MSDNYDPVNMPVTQVGIVGGDQFGSAVTRQRGLPPVPFASVDPTPPPAVVQGSTEIHTTRQDGPGQHFLADGTLMADHVAPDHTVYGDIPTIAVGEANQPLVQTDIPLPRDAFDYAHSAAAAGAALQPSIDRTAIRAMAEAAGFIVRDADAGAPPAVPPVVGVMQADQPGDGGDPRDPDSKPQVLSASALPTIRKAPVVPLVLPTPKVRRAKAGTK